MVGKVDYSSVPTTVDLENNSNQKKYTINRTSGKGVIISKPLCALMAIGALLLAILVGLVVFFLVPRYCNGQEGTPEPLTKASQGVTEVDKVTKEVDEGTPEPLTKASQGVTEVDKVTKEVDERLPRDIEPTQYRLQIIPYLENSTTSGAITINLNVLEETNKIIFHINNITISNNSVMVHSTKPNSKQLAINVQDYIESQKYRIILNENLQKGENYNVSLKFTGILNNHLQGFYKSQYTDLHGKPRFTASTQFSPTDARRAFPCFDEPSFKAKFTISIARPQNLTTLSNMPLAKSDIFAKQNEWYWDHYPETPKMSTYLVAFIVSDLEAVSSSHKMIKIWTRKNYISHANYSASIVPKILKYFENYFMIQFPLPKIDIVAVPEFGFSAMENWGLITFRESSLLFDPVSSSHDDLRTISTVLSHEIAHQWFGNLVTPKWWNDLWLKEGFATYLEYFGVNEAEPTWKVYEEFLPSETQRAMAIDALQSSTPISSEVKNSRQIRQAFDEISYAKGACIIRMMNHFLGEAVFKNGLINFLRKYKNSNADRQDLFVVLTEESHKSKVLLPNETVKHIMDTWTEKAGFPVITATADHEKNNLRISQKRFYFGDKEEKSTWWVPISFTQQEKENFFDTKPKFWLRGENEIEAKVNFTQWYILNLNHTGYYIVNYDDKNWNALVEHIMEIPALTRAQLISDSMDLARANMINYDIPLRMIARMAVNDIDIMYIPTLTALNKLRFLSDILSFTPVFGLFEAYHQAIFKNTYDRVTLEDNESNTYLTRRIRKAVLEWSCRSTDSACVHHSRVMFRSWMAARTEILPNLREIVYCTAIREGGEIEWEFAYNKYLETESQSEKNRLLDALGCTELGWLLSRYVDKLNSDAPSIRIQDADRVFESVARNKIGTHIAFDFLRNNWNELLNNFGDGFNILAKMIKSLAPRMNTEFQLQELERFRDSVKDNISTTSRAFNSAIDTVKSNVYWMKTTYDQVENWLIKNKDQFRFL